MRSSKLDPGPTERVLTYGMGSVCRQGGDVVGGHDVDRGSDGLDGTVDGTLGLHDDVTREPHVVPQVVVQDGGQAFVVEQLQVVPVEVVPDEHVAAPVGGVER